MVETFGQIPRDITSLPHAHREHERVCLLWRPGRIELCGLSQPGVDFGILWPKFQQSMATAIRKPGWPARAGTLARICCGSAPARAGVHTIRRRASEAAPDPL